MKYRIVQFNNGKYAKQVVVNFLFIFKIPINSFKDLKSKVHHWSKRSYHFHDCLTDDLKSLYEEDFEIKRVITETKLEKILK